MGVKEKEGEVRVAEKSVMVLRGRKEGRMKKKTISNRKSKMNKGVIK